MAEKLPEVTFKYAYPLDMNRRELFAQKDLGEYPSVEEVEEETEKWQDMWAELNEDNQAIRAIVDITGIIYPQDIQAFVIGGGLNPMSTPLILPKQRYKSEKDGAREQLILHEILHLFVGDQQELPQLEEYWDFVAEEYADESPKTQHHIIIYAVLTKLLNQLRPDVSLEDFIGDDWDNYLRALEIVKEEGVENVIEGFRNRTE